MDTSSGNAHYLIQVSLIYKPKRANIFGSFTVWRKEGRFGFSDEIMKFCPTHGCLGVLPYTLTVSEEELSRFNPEDPIADWPEDIRLKHDNWHTDLVACPKCKTMCPREQLADTYMFNLTPGKIAERMAQLFRELGSDADIYLVRSVHGNMFTKAKEELKSANRNVTAYNKMLGRARRREQAFYPLKRIILDAQNSTVEKRFLALVKA